MKTNYTHETANYYCNGEDKMLTCRKWRDDGIHFKYEYKTTYMHGIGNNLTTMIHALMKHGNVNEHVEVYKNGILIKAWNR